MENEAVRIVETQDGSHSLISERFGVSYHSKYGAVQESRHVFIEAGLHLKLPGLSVVNVLEMGFGSGLNALLSLLAAHETEKAITYHAVEAFPITLEQAQALNYSDFLASDSIPYQALFQELHRCSWGEEHPISDKFTFLKWLSTIEDQILPSSFYHVVYFDAFAPSSQPELWTPDVLGKFYDALTPGGVLVTYCAKGTVKRALKSLGFKVEGIPGPPGKREMTRAIKV